MDSATRDSPGCDWNSLLSRALCEDGALCKTGYFLYATLAAGQAERSARRIIYWLRRHCSHRICTGRRASRAAAGQNIAHGRALPANSGFKVRLEGVAKQTKRLNDGILTSAESIDFDSQNSIAWN